MILDTMALPFGLASARQPYNRAGDTGNSRSPTANSAIVQKRPSTARGPVPYDRRPMTPGDLLELARGGDLDAFAAHRAAQPDPKFRFRARRLVDPACRMSNRRVRLAVPAIHLDELFRGGTQAQACH
jgi:hypothetical protein